MSEENSKYAFVVNAYSGYFGSHEEPSSPYDKYKKNHGKVEYTAEILTVESLAESGGAKCGECRLNGNHCRYEFVEAPDTSLYMEFSTGLCLDCMEITVAWTHEASRQHKKLLSKIEKKNNNEICKTTSKTRWPTNH